MLSVNTNKGAMVALQNLSSTNKELEETENRISTGKKVATAKDNGAVWAVANKMNSDVSAYDSVASSTERASSLLDTAITAGESISDLLTQMKEIAVSASQTGLSASSISEYNAQFTELRDQITSIVKNSNFDGQNMVGGGADLADAVAIGDATGSNNITVAGADLSLGGSTITVAATTEITDATTAGTALTAINTSIDNLGIQLAKWGAGSTRLDTHSEFISNLQDSLNSGIGALTDADLSAESAKLTALQTKQQLGAQALSIANSTSQIALSLFQ